MPEIVGTLTETGRSARVAMDGPRLAAVEEAEVARGSWIAPGFIDLQVNGYAGHDVHAAQPSADEVGAMVRALWTRSVTTSSRVRASSTWTAAPRAACGASGAATASSIAAIDVDAPAAVLATVLYEGCTSRGEADFGDKVLSAMRFGFGGHLEKHA